MSVATATVSRDGVTTRVFFAKSLVIGNVVA